ncbi:MAG: hypothetical protein ACRCXT_11015 [Paraclostridium sp.]
METSIFKYNMFLANELAEQAEYEAFMNEAILISVNENTIDRISILNESFSEKLKSTILKIIGVFRKIWEKFIESVDVLIKNDASYLEKYKETILKRSMNKDAEYHMYNYSKGVYNIVNSPVPAYDYNKYKDILVDEKSFINGTNIKNYKIGEGSENNSDTFKSYFRGSLDQSWIKGSQLNMTDMYNYCRDYKNIKDKIEKDKTNIVKAADESIKLIDKMAAENKIKNESFMEYFEDEPSKYLSFVYESYINEKVDPDGNSSSGGESKANTGTSSNTPDANKDKESKSIGGGVQVKSANNAYKGIDGEKKDTKEDDVKSDSAKIASDRVKVYLNVCCDIIAAKLTVSEEIYKAYMAIIKAHVRDHLGEKANSKNTKRQDKGTNYNNGKDDNSEKANTSDLDALK